MLESKTEGFVLREAAREDAPLILGFIRALAGYENMLSEVGATQEDIERFLFDEKTAEVIIGEYKKEPVAFALYFKNFSTFEGKPGIYLEDLFVKPEYRSRGFGRALFSFLAELAVRRGYSRVEWMCLDWNEPSIGFYKAIGGVPLEEWTKFRLAGEALCSLAGCDH